VLVALIDNALTYTPQERYVSLSLDVADGYAVVQISDTGIGISAAYLRALLSRRPRSRLCGSGLGLAIAQSIIEAHLGGITMESTPGKGSKFILRVLISSSFPSAHQELDVS
jgi:two-component system OmpR family sensor kinase